MRLDFRASERHFVDHLVPVWRALPEAARGRFCVANGLQDHLRRYGIDPTTAEPRSVIVVVASYGDLKATEPRKAILVNHGAGQTFTPPHASYSGGPDRERVLLFLEPNARTAAWSKIAYPRARIAVVGCPKLDRWVNAEPREHATTPVVAFSWHWDCQHVPETRSAWPHYREQGRIFRRLAERYRLLGHGHPRILDELRPWYETLGIPVEPDFQNVVEHADVYVADGVSTLYEFAATGRPVVVMNAPWYRREVEHGLRFWEHADVGYQTNEAKDLPAAIARALRDPITQQQRRAKAVEAAYGTVDGQAAIRAAEAILSLLESSEVNQMPPRSHEPTIRRSAVRRRLNAPVGRQAVREPEGEQATRQPPPWRRQVSPKRGSR